MLYLLRLNTSTTLGVKRRRKSIQDKIEQKDTRKLDKQKAPTTASTGSPRLPPKRQKKEEPEKVEKELSEDKSDGKIPPKCV